MDDTTQNQSTDTGIETKDNQNNTGAQTPQVKTEEGKVPRSEMEKVAKELKKYKEAEAKRIEQEALAKGEFEKVIAEKEAKIKQLEDEMSNAQLSRKAESALKSANLDDSLLDIMTDYVISQAKAGGKTVDEVIVNLIQSRPAIFGTQKTVSQIGLGVAPKKTPNSYADQADNASLSEYLQSIKT